MSKILEDILSLKLEPHLDRLDYLVLAASSPDSESIHRGIQYISELSRTIRAIEEIKKSDDLIVKSNRLAGFFNHDFGLVLSSEKTDNICEVLKKMLTKRINPASSLSITLLHNAMASKFRMLRNFEVICQDGYYAPNLKDKDYEYSIFLHNCENKGRPFHFRKQKVIHTFEAISRLANKTKSNPSLDPVQKEFLDNLSKRLLELKVYLPPPGKLVLVKRESEGSFPVGMDYSIYREYYGFTQKEIARKVGKSRQVYSDYERGIATPTPETDRKIRKLLGMPIETKPSEKPKIKISEPSLKEPKEKEPIGEQYKSYRETKGLSQKDVADAIGKGESAYRHYEKGRITPSEEIDKKIRDILGMSIKFESEGQEYRFYREKKSLLQKEVADAIGKSRQTYSDYENGKVIPTAEIDLEVRYTLDMPIEFGSVAEEYKFYRKKKELSQKDVAAYIKKGKTTYGDYETGKIIPTSLLDRRIRRRLGIKGSVYHPGNIYRSARKKQKLSRKEVGESIGKSEAGYGTYERGDVIPDVYTARKLEEVLKF